MTDQDDEIIQEFTIRRRGMLVERNAKGEIISATIPNPFVVDQLHELEIIDGEQRLSAMHFIAMRRCFLRDVARIASVTLYQTPGDTPDAPKYPIEDTDYLKVLRMIRHAPHKAVIDDACADDADMVTFYRLAAIDMRPRVRDAFKSLTVAVNLLMEKKKQAAIAAERLKNQS